MSSQDKHEKREKNARLALGVLLAVVEEYVAWHKLNGRPPDFALIDQVKSQVQWATSYATGQQEPTPLKPTPPTQRLNILAALYGETPPAEKYLPLQELNLTDTSPSIFPIAESVDKAQKHTHLLQQLTQQIKELKKEADAVTQLRLVLATLQQYGYALPSLYDQEVSLYDQARVTAALAVGYEAAVNDPQKRVAILLKGDISGVQNFIYTITARGAASGLRGRSFYLQLLTEAIAHFVLVELGLPPTNMLYIGGGHFYLLLPTDITEIKIKEIQKKVSQQLLTYHQGELYVALGQTTFTAEMFCDPEKFGKGWGKLTEKVNQAKNAPFSELGEEMYGRVFALPLPKDEAVSQNRGGGESNECKVCHYDGLDVKPDELDENSPKRLFCSLCESLEQFGQALRRSDYLLLTEHTPQIMEERTFQSVLRSFGLSAAALEVDNSEGREAEEQIKTIIYDEFHNGLQNLTVFRHFIWQLKAEADPLSYSFKKPTALINRYSVQVIPEIKDQAEIEAWRGYQKEQNQFKQEKDNLRPEQVKPFDILTFQAEGIKRFGVLRMDVDNLGQVFSKGLGEKNSLVKTAALSLAMTLYFEGWVGQLAQQANNYPSLAEKTAGCDNLQEMNTWPKREVERDVVYSVYSGGDDLFIVAAWDVLPLLAYQINADFKRYASGNSRLHASAGLSLHTAKYPIYQAAEAADEALTAAKGLSEGKNAFTFLGRTRPWADFPDIWKEVIRLNEIMNFEDAPTRLLHLLRQYEMKYFQQVQEWRTNQVQHSSKEAQPVFWGPWQWRTAYLLARLEERLSKNNKDLAKKIAEIRSDLHLEKFGYIEKLGLSGRWLELCLRNKG